MLSRTTRVQWSGPEKLIFIAFVPCCHKEGNEPALSLHSDDCRSPAPPVVALAGRLAMLIGEQVVPMAKRLATGHALHVGRFKSEIIPHVVGHMSKASAAVPGKPKEERT